MEKQRRTSYVVLLSVLGAAICFCAWTTEGHRDSTSPVRMSLPLNLEAYEGVDILHCQNEQCVHTHLSIVLTNKTACPDCLAPLATVSLAEKELLPKDTEILHKLYRGKRGREFLVSVVIGGYERRSIHKPQVCLVAQGHRINKQYPVDIELEGGRSLGMTLMELDASRRVYAYWFTNGEIETASHLKRLFWTAWDGIAHNRRRRWAYISIFSTTANGRVPMADLQHFVGQLYPATLPHKTASE